MDPITLALLGIGGASLLTSTAFGINNAISSKTAKKKSDLLQAMQQTSADRTQNTNAFGETLAQSSADENNDGIDTENDNILASTDNNSDVFDIRDIIDDDEDKAKLGTRRTYDRIGQYMQFRCGGRKKKDLGGIGAREKARRSASGSTALNVLNGLGNFMQNAASIGANIIGAAGTTAYKQPKQPVEVRNLQNVLDDVNKNNPVVPLTTLNDYLLRCGGRYKFRCK